MSALIPPDVRDRLMAAFRALIRTEDPNRNYRALYEYVVAATDGKTVDVRPADGSVSMPELRGVPILTGLAGGKCTPAVGSHLAIGFLNGDPTRPAVVGAFDSSSAQQVTIDGGTGTAEHVLTVEAFANILIACAPLIGPGINTLNEASLALQLTAVAGASNITILTIAAIKQAMALKQQAGGDGFPIAGTSPGIGCPNVLTG